MKLALAISVAFAIFACIYLHAQPPMPPGVVEGSQLMVEGPEVPATFTRMAVWDRAAANNSATGLRLTVNNAATNYQIRLPITATNSPVQVVLGSNWISLAATNAIGSATAQLAGAFVVSNWCEFICLGRTNLAAPWVRIDPKPQLTRHPMLYSRAMISNWTTTNWQ